MYQVYVSLYKLLMYQVIILPCFLLVACRLADHAVGINRLSTIWLLHSATNGSMMAKTALLSLITAS